MRRKDNAGHQPRPARLSAVLLTLNEEKNVEFCLRSLRSWCDEIVVVDNLSDDRTPLIAAGYADVMLTHERNNVGIQDAQRRAAFAAASGDWILSIDADEVVTPELAREAVRPSRN
jgi:(heptosyl)LPS beta-1,4-glucosyltransferase